MSGGSNDRYPTFYFQTGKPYDSRSVPGHFLCATLAVLAHKAKQIPRHHVLGCVTPPDVDFGPHDIPTDSETIYDHALNGYGFIGRKAGDMKIAGKTFSISHEYSKISPSLLIRPIDITMTIRGSIRIESWRGAYQEDNEMVKQQWPPFTLWSKSDVEEFNCLGDVINRGLSYYDLGMFLTELTGDFPPKPPFDPQNWGSYEKYDPGCGDSHSRFTAYQTDKKKQTFVFKHCEELNRSLWCPLQGKSDDVSS